jgi:hypothetical protein
MDEVNAGEVPPNNAEEVPPNKQAIVRLTCNYDEDKKTGTCVPVDDPLSAMYTGPRARRDCNEQCERPLREAKTMGLYTHENPLLPSNVCKTVESEPLMDGLQHIETVESEPVMDGLRHIALDSNDKSRLMIVLPNGKEFCTTPESVIDHMNKQTAYAIWSRDDSYEKYSVDERKNAGKGYSVHTPKILLKVFQTGFGNFHVIHDDKMQEIIRYLTAAKADPSLPTVPLALVRTTIPGILDEDGEVGRYRYGNAQGARVVVGSQHAQWPGTVVYLLRAAYTIPGVGGSQALWFRIPEEIDFRKLVQETIRLVGMVHPLYGFIGDWDTSAVMDMSWAFAAPYGQSEVDLSGIKYLRWDTQNVTDMSYMFYNCESFNGDLGAWRFPEVEDMNNMFFGCVSFNGDVRGWRFPAVVDMNNMFSYATSFNGEVGQWDFPEVIDMGNMFSYATSFNGDVRGWRFPSVEDMSYMFRGATSFNGEVGQWDFPWVVTMRKMFEKATSFNGDVSRWEFPKVTNMSRMFSNAISFNSVVRGWTFPQLIDFEGMFDGATAFEGDMSEWTFPRLTVGLANYEANMINRMHTKRLSEGDDILAEGRRLIR